MNLCKPKRSYNLLLQLAILVVGAVPLDAQKLTFQRIVGASDYPWGTAIDATGIYVGSTTRVAGDTWDTGVVRKLNTEGAELWSIQLSARFVLSVVVAVSEGDVYAAAVAYPQSSPAFSTRGAVLLAKYTSDGQEQWTHELGYTRDVVLSADHSGVYIIGGGLFRKYDPAGNEVLIRSIDWLARGVNVFHSVVYSVGFGLGSYRAPVIAKYDSSGTAVWTRGLNSPGWGFLAIAVDDGGVYATTQSHLHKFSLEGQSLWTREIPNFAGYLRAVAADASGAYVVGMSSTGSRASARLEHPTPLSSNTTPSVTSSGFVNSARLRMTTREEWSSTPRVSTWQGMMANSDSSPNWRSHRKSQSIIVPLSHGGVLLMPAASKEAVSHRGRSFPFSAQT